VHASACSLVFFSQGRDTAALWRQGRTGKTSGPLGAGDSCRSISSLASHAPHRKTKGTHAIRVTLFYPSMDTKGVDCPERKRPPQRDTNKAFRLPFRAIASARRGWARSEKDTLAFLLPERRAPSFFRISSFQPRYHVKLSSVTYIATTFLYLIYLYFP
jgi:hypothetical protein